MQFLGTVLILAALGATAYLWVKRKKSQQDTRYVMPYQINKTSWISRVFSKKMKKQTAYSNALTKPCLIEISLFAESDYGYGSYGLLQAFSNINMHYGHMNIFHRYDHSGELLFSIASITQPGTFDLNTIGSFSTPGLVIFAEMDRVKDPLKTFDLMMEAASALVEELGGTLYENKQTPMTQQTVEKIREQLYNAYPVETVA